MIGQAWTLVLSVLAERRILVVHFSKTLNSLGADLEAIQARKPTMRQYPTVSTDLLVLRYPRVFFLFNQLFMRDWWPHCSRHDDFFLSLDTLEPQ